MKVLHILGNAVIDGVNDAITDSGAGEDSVDSILKNLVNTAIVVIGMVAVVMIVVGAVQLQVSQGDGGKIKKAKDTIMYGIIGLVVAILAFAIVNFVLGSLF